MIENVQIRGGALVTGKQLSTEKADGRVDKTNPEWNGFLEVKAGEARNKDR